MHIQHKIYLVFPAPFKNAIDNYKSVIDKHPGFIGKIFVVERDPKCIKALFRYKSYILFRDIILMVYLIEFICFLFTNQGQYFIFYIGMGGEKPAYSPHISFLHQPPAQAKPS